MTVPASTQAILSGTKPWVRLVSIVGFITAGLMILFGVVFLALGAVSGLSGELAGLGILAIVYPLFGLLYLVPSIYLFQYAIRIGQFVNGGGQEVQLDLALESQRAFWKSIGILCIIGIALTALSFLAALIIPFVL